MINKTNMYQHSVYQWNPFVGCKHQCVYCLSSFQAQIKRWAKKNCPECYKFEPHYRHLEDRLKQQLPRTKFMQFIFTCSNGDVAFCKTESLRKIVDRIRSESSKTFLIQSKDPEKFNRLIFPDNVILGITLETNRNKNYGKYSKAPIPSKRYGDFLAVKHPLKMVTVEPVMDFDLNVMVHWIKKINPCMVWIGYDSKSNKLPEPELLKVLELHWQLSKAHITTILKKISPPADILPFSNKLTGG